MPHAIKLQRELGPQGLIVIMMESQGSTLENLPAFMINKFPDNVARVTVQSGIPIDTKAGGIPRCALIGVDGTLLISGFNSAIGKKVEKLIEEELGKLKKGWGADPQVRKARALLHGKGDLAAARKILEGLQLEGDAQADRDAAMAELETKYAAMKNAVEHHMKEGRWLDAVDAAKALEKGTKGVEAWDAEVAAITAKLETDEAKKEVALAKKLERMLAPITEKGPKDGDSGMLSKFAKANAGSSVGARAERLAAAITAGGGGG